MLFEFQMSILASSMVRPNSSEQALIVWLWQTAYKLHLHLIDQSDADIKISLSNPLTAFTAIPDLESESEVSSDCLLFKMFQLLKKITQFLMLLN